MEKEFEEKMAEMANGLKKALSENQTTELNNACILKARHDLLDITFAKMVDVAADRPTAEIWRSIWREQNAVVEGLLTVIEKLKPAVKGDVDAMHSEVAQAQRETHDLLEAAKNLESEMQRHIQEKEEMKKQFEAEKKELQNQVSTLEEENKKYLDTIIKRSKVLGVPTPSITAKDSPTRAGADPTSKDKKVNYI